MPVTFAATDNHLQKIGASGLVATNAAKTMMYWLYLTIYGADDQSIYNASSSTNATATQLGTFVNRVSVWNWTFSNNLANTATTTIAAGSNGLALPQATINVVATSPGTMVFPSSGTLSVTTSTGVQTVTYTGKSATSFTGCTGGAGTMSTGGLVDHTPSRNAWHHIAYVYTGTNNVLYVDGFLVDNNTNVNNSGGGLPLDFYFNGFETGGVSETSPSSMDDVRYYNRVLSGSEIQTIFVSDGHDGIVSGLVSRFMLNEAASGNVTTNRDIGTAVPKNDLSTFGAGATPPAYSVSPVRSQLSKRRRV